MRIERWLTHSGASRYLAVLDGAISAHSSNAIPALNPARSGRHDPNQFWAALQFDRMRDCKSLTKGSTRPSADSGQLAAHDGGSGYHRLHLAEGDLARQILETAVGCHDDALRRHVRQGSADAVGDRLWRLHRHI